jgi:hypothetical protein
MFNNSINKQLVKLDVLESKLNIYETLSREMLDKLEAAVDKISDANQHIANILTKHDERIEQSIKTDELLVKMIDDGKKQNTVEHNRVIVRIESIEKNVNDLIKFRWQAAAIIGATILLAGIIVPLLDNTLPIRYDGGNQQTHTK